MRVYSNEFRVQMVRRILNGETVSALSEESGIHRKLLYEWVHRVQEAGESNLRTRGRPRKNEAKALAAESVTHQIAELKRTIAHQQVIIEFFRLALPRFESLRQNASAPGATASSASLRP